MPITDKQLEEKINKLPTPEEIKQQKLDSIYTENLNYAVHLLIEKAVERNSGSLKVSITEIQEILKWFKEHY